MQFICNFKGWAAAKETKHPTNESLMRTLANSEDQMKYQNMRHLIKIYGTVYSEDRKRSSEKEIHLPTYIITYDSSKYTMNYPKFIIPDQKEESITT